MTSRERVIAAINHQQPDRVPIDFGSTGQTGINVCAEYRLREYLGLPKKDLDTFEIIQMLGVVDEDLRQVMKSDVIGMNHPEDSMGVPNTGEKKRFIMPDGTPALINAGNEFDILPTGARQMYPQGDRNAPPSTYMPEGGTFFDIVDRAPEVDEDNLTPREDFKNFFSVMRLLCTTKRNPSVCMKKPIMPSSATLQVQASVIRVPFLLRLKSIRRASASLTSG